MKRGCKHKNKQSIRVWYMLIEQWVGVFLYCTEKYSQIEKCAHEGILHTWWFCSWFRDLFITKWYSASHYTCTFVHLPDQPYPFRLEKFSLVKMGLIPLPFTPIPLVQNVPNHWQLGGSELDMIAHSGVHESLFKTTSMTADLLITSWIYTFLLQNRQQSCTRDPSPLHMVLGLFSSLFLHHLFVSRVIL